MSRGRSLVRGALVLAFLSAAISLSAEDLIIRTAKPYGTIKQKIAALGGSVTYEFRNANALVVRVPDAKVDAVKGLTEVLSAVRDQVVPNPRPRESFDLTSQLPAGSTPIAVPANYFPYTTGLTDALPLIQAGFLGQGVVVGVIDTGVSASSAAVGSRVIGGENFVPGATEPGATSSANGDHGTFVACMIGANTAFGFAHDGALATAVRTYCVPPASPAPCSFDAGGGVDGIPMVGQAPAARFYALKVFAAAGGGAPESRILQAMDRAVELKGTTQPDMKVVNMSLGGTTLFAAGDVEDELATSMSQAGISLVVSAGNAGPSGMTVGSPGTAKSILTVGAASSPVHERILRDLQFGPGIGPFYRPDDNQQMAYFSSRGPDANGRSNPEVVANGFASYVEGAAGDIFLASGTSFSAPTVSGVAALIYSALPNATPAKVRAAIVRSANSNAIPSAHREDDGAGYVDAAAAKALLDKGVLPVLDLAPSTPNVAVNVLLSGAGIPIVFPHFTTHVGPLKPAERREFFFLVDPNTASVRVTLSHVTPALSPAQQNIFFGDDLLFAVHSAKTSQIGEAGDYLAFANVGSDQSFVFDRPENGLIRVTVNGDWTNAGGISTDVTIEEEKGHLSKKDFQGNIAEGQEATHTVDIPPGTASVTFRLSWNSDWSAYPTDDLDMFVEAPDGTINADGATINSPETVTIANPTPGQWTIFVDGFTVWSAPEHYEVRVD